MKAAWELLKALTAFFPPDAETRHNLTMQGEKLSLTLHIGGKWHSFLLDDRDMTTPVDELVNEIAALLKSAGN